MSNQPIPSNPVKPDEKTAPSLTPEVTTGGTQMPLNPGEVDGFFPEEPKPGQAQPGTDPDETSLGKHRTWGDNNPQVNPEKPLPETETPATSPETGPLTDGDLDGLFGHDVEVAPSEQPVRRGQAQPSVDPDETSLGKHRTWGGQDEKA